MLFPHVPAAPSPAPGRQAPGVSITAPAQAPGHGGVGGETEGE